MVSSIDQNIDSSIYYSLIYRSDYSLIYRSDYSLIYRSEYKLIYRSDYRLIYSLDYSFIYTSDYSLIYRPDYSVICKPDYSLIYRLDYSVILSIRKNSFFVNTAVLFLVFWFHSFHFLKYQTLIIKYCFVCLYSFECHVKLLRLFML